jgi:threonylcarbamoyladenosine tRNA methylthiotransferase MtaB
MKFASMHVFPYSRRKGTAADEMKGHLDRKIKNERTKKIIELADIMKNEHELKFINSIQEVLVERQKDNF